MCRYGLTSYKSHFVCFACRKMFRKAPPGDYRRHNHITIRPPLREDGRRMNRAEMLAAHNAAYRDFLWQYRAAVSTCPQCGGGMNELGLDFRPPPQRDVEAWQIIAHLYERNFRFFGCGCGGVGYAPPKRLRELPAWLRAHEPEKTGGAALLQAIAAKNA